MKLKHLLLSTLCCVFSLHTSGQKVLEQGIITYKIARPEKTTSKEAEELCFYFGKNAAFQRIIPANKEGVSLILSDFATSKMTTIMLTATDTIQQSSFLASDSAKSEVQKLFKVRESRKKTKQILGYDCTYFSIIPSKKSPLQLKIVGWATKQIQSKILPFPMDMGVRWPGFPLNFWITDLETDSILEFKTQSVEPLLDTILEARKQEVLQLSERQHERYKNRLQEYFDSIKRQDSFKNNTTVTLNLQVDSLWEITQQNHQIISLECKPLFARCYISRELVKHYGEFEEQMTELIQRKQEFLVTLESPTPPLKTMEFQGNPAKQQVWNFHNKAILDQYIFPKEYNPFDFFPMEDLVVLQRAFILQGIVCFVIVQTTKANFEKVMPSVDHMLETLKIKGIY